MSKDNNEIVTEEERTEVYVYLTKLRVSENAPNMMGAFMYLREEFGFDINGDEMDQKKKI